MWGGTSHAYEPLLISYVNRFAAVNQHLFYISKPFLEQY
jgi:hypothetical protein